MEVQLKLTYSEADERALPAALPADRNAPLKEIRRNAPQHPPTRDDTAASGFEAILEAFAREPERWDLLE